MESRYPTEDEVWISLGSSPVLDILNPCLLTTVSLVGAALSALAFVIFLNKRKFDRTIPLYVYLRVYTFSNIFLCLMNALAGLTATNRSIKFTHSFGAQIFFNYIYSSTSNILFFYTSILSIVILLDRIALFIRPVKSLMTKLTPTQICLLTFIIVFIIDVPFYLSYGPTENTFRLNNSDNLTLWFSTVTEFTSTKAGMILTLISYILKDIVVLIVEIAVNLVSFVLLRSYLKRKFKHQQSEGGSSVAVGSIANPVYVNARQIASSEQKASLMVILVCFCSFIAHVLTVLSSFYSYTNINFTGFVLYFSLNVCLSLKCIVDFLVFLFCNKNFKIVFQRYFRISCQF